MTGFINGDRILMVSGDIEDQFLVSFAERLIANSNAQVILIEITGNLISNRTYKERIRRIEQTAPNHISVRRGESLE